MKALLFCFFFLTVAAHGYTPIGKSGKSIRTNGSQSDVQAAVDSAPDNGSATVIIPSGTFDWSGTLNIRKAVTVAGEGVDSTTIRNQNGNSNLILAQSGKNGDIVIYGFKVLAVADNGGGRGFHISASRDESTQHTVKIHDCEFDQNNIYAYSLLCGSNGILIWNCSFTGGQGMGGVSFVVDINNYDLYNHPSTLGTKDPDGLHNSYVEDCSFRNANIGIANFDANSRSVWRHNTMQDCQMGSHGQETSPNGVTHWEIYDNTFKVSKDNPFNLQNWLHIRGGTGVIARNNIDEIPFKSQFILTIFSITRGANDGAGGTFCPVEYPAPRQTGWAWADNNKNWGKVEDEQNPQLLEGGRSPGYFLPNGKGAVCDPIYIWDTTGSGANASSFVWAQTYEPDNCGNRQVIENYLQKGRDYFVNQGAKPGWTPYPYPHPLRASGGGGGPQPTPTPNPTATPPGSHRYQILMESDSPMYMTPLPQK